MLKSLSEFQALSGSELSQMVEHGPVLITDQEEPKFVAQAVEDFEALVRRLRNWEQASVRRQKLRVVSFRPFPRNVQKLDRIENTGPRNLLK